MSASWDPEVEGSILGVQEFQTNIGNIQDGLRRSRENALLRERMRKIPRDEMRSEMKRLDKEDESKKEKGMGLKEKLEKDDRFDNRFNHIRGILMRHKGFVLDAAGRNPAVDRGVE